MQKFLLKDQNDYQDATWSDYKHHNTIKHLVGISPSGFITFLRWCYGGRASDKFITKDSVFYDLLERDDVVMADRGFLIQEDLLLHICHLQVPPSARTKSQMTKKRDTRDKRNCKFTNSRWERAINRIKNYRILKGTLPITMMQHIDVVLVCTALCNLKNVLIQTKKDY